MREIATLTGLRGFAALWVLLLHYTWGWKGDSYWLSVATHGGSGVIIFFVLSGFILSYVYAKEFSNGVTWAKYWSFLRARFARVYPLHVAMLMVWTTLVWSGTIGPNAGDTIFSLILNFLLMHAWGFVDLISWNQPSWSISTEAFCYLFFPLIIVAFSVRSFIIFFIAVLSIWSISGFYAPYPFIVSTLIGSGWLKPGVQFANALSLVQFFWQFVLGVVLFSCTRRIEKFIPRFVYDGVTMIGIGILLYSCTIPYFDALVVVGATLLVFGLYSDAGLGRLIFGNPISVFLGEISYSLYLSHIIILIMFQIYVGSVALAIKIPVALAVATLLHFGLERPLRSFLRPYSSKLARIVSS